MHYNIGAVNSHPLIGVTTIIHNAVKTAVEFVRTHKYAWLVLYFPVYILAFFIIEANTPPSGYWVTDLPLDEYIPFVPGFAIFYVIWYPLFAMAGIPVLIKDGEAFKRWMYYNMIVLTGTLIFDVLVPNGQHLRPENVEVNSLGTWIMSILWAADTPTNVFPSMHVLGCLGDIACCFDSKVFKPWMRAVITILCVLCMASTVLVKQHAIIDTVGSIAVAAVVLPIVYRKRIFRKSAATERLES